jgi:hypothetical protein
VVIHRESAIVGMRIAMAAVTGSIPPDDKLYGFLESAKLNDRVEARAFPLDLMNKALGDRMQERKVTADRYLQVMLHHVPDPSLVTMEQADRLAAVAWTLSRAMEEQAFVAEQLDNVGKS